MRGAVAQLRPGAAVVDHAHVADVVELGRGERGDAVAPQALDDARGEEVGDGQARPPGVRDEARERQRGRAGEVEDAAHAGAHGLLDGAHHVVLVHHLHHRVEAEERGDGLEAQVVGGRVAHAAEDVHGAQDHRLGLRALPEEGLRQHVDLDEVADLAEGGAAEEGRVLREELRVVRPRAVDVGAGEHDQLGHLVLGDELEQALEAGHVPGVVLGLADARVVEDAEVDHRREPLLAEDVLRLLAADVELVVLDVLGAAVEGAAVDADDGHLAVEAARQAAAQAAADAGDEDGTLARILGRSVRVRRGAAREAARGGVVGLGRPRRSRRRPGRARALAFLFCSIMGRDGCA